MKIIMTYVWTKSGLLTWWGSGERVFKSSAVAGGIFKAWPSWASLSPEVFPASYAGPAWGHCELPLSCGEH